LRQAGLPSLEKPSYLSSITKFKNLVGNFSPLASKLREGKEVTEGGKDRWTLASAGYAFFNVQKMHGSWNYCDALGLGASGNIKSGSMIFHPMQVCLMQVRQLQTTNSFIE